MRTIPIASIEVETSGRLAVRPEPLDTSMFECVYRAGRGVRWRDSDGAFIPYEPAGLTPDKWFSVISDAARDELGLELRIGVATKWLSVPEDVRREIELRADAVSSPNNSLHRTRDA